jgi:hypothetical protein
MSEIELSGLIFHSPSLQSIGPLCMIACGREQLVDLLNRSVFVLATNDAGIRGLRTY